MALIRKIKLIILLLIPLIVFAGDLVKVKRVVDGDTFVADAGERVRLIGVDTPETVHPKKSVEFYGKEASAFLDSLIEGKIVRLEYDWNQKDKYGRILAYVWLDTLFINAEIIGQGYGHAYLKYPFKQEYMSMFRQLETEAREAGRGLWISEKSE